MPQHSPATHLLVDGRYVWLLQDDRFLLANRVSLLQTIVLCHGTPVAATRLHILLNEGDFHIRQVVLC